MRKIFNDPFTSILPQLDLHGETYETAPFLINSFVNDNFVMGKTKVVLIHGRHGDVLRKRCHEVLKGNKNVKNYNIDANNNGQTIVELYNKE